MARPETILFIRHAEKPNAWSQGIDQDGNPDRESLTPRGWQRAGALAVIFRTDPRLPLPTALFAPRPTSHAPSRRALQTITPLADWLRLDVDSAHAKDDFETLLVAATNTPGVVLIAWEHKVLGTALAAGLGPGIAIHGKIPRAWPDDRFDLIWSFEQVAQDHYRFTQLPQLALAGDSVQPID